MATTFFDLKKAFHTVNHNILIKKLKVMGISDNLLDCVENYLSSRYQKTLCNNTVSSMNKVLCGVPQGSILGPLLFLVYVNDMEYILGDVKFQLYAEETVLYISGKNDIEVNMNLQKELKFINWCEINQLTVNIKRQK